MHKISINDVLGSILFPRDFVWGMATSAYQIEGAHDTDGRAPSIWDTFTRQPGAILDNSNGDVACDHYARLEQDLDLLQQLGMPNYRFSISWSRVQPLGQGAWNEAGLAFYERLLNGLAARGIAAHLTLYHWDLPQALQDEGGWGVRSTAMHFADYARVLASRFGAQLASIATLNEPWVAATLGHEVGIFAPGLKDRRLAMQVSHHLLLGHGLAMQAMRDALRASGTTVKLGIVLNQGPVHAASDSALDLAKARLEDGLLIRWYMDPLLRGEYPQDVLQHLGADAPQVEAGDMAIITAPLDYLGLNYYTRSIVSSKPGGKPGSTGNSDAASPVIGPLGTTDMGWEVYPAGLSELLRRLKRDYDLPPIYITENGAAYQDEKIGLRVHDELRTSYLKMHVAAVHEAIVAGVDVRGYFAWSFLDNFEWAFGYGKRFGLVHVDYATQERTVKDSGLWYRSFIAQQQRTSVVLPQQD
jgi:beta-glucosidase